MLTQEEIKEHKEKIEKLNQENETKRNIIATGKAKTEQGVELIKKYNLDSLSVENINKIESLLEEQETIVRTERKTIEQELLKIGELKENYEKAIV
jgi:exonuclease III